MERVSERERRESWKRNIFNKYGKSRFCYLWGKTKSKVSLWTIMISLRSRTAVTVTTKNDLLSSFCLSKARTFWVSYSGACCTWGNMVCMVEVQYISCWRGLSATEWHVCKNERPGPLCLMVKTISCSRDEKNCTPWPKSFHLGLWADSYTKIKVLYSSSTGIVKAATFFWTLKSCFLTSPIDNVIPIFETHLG